jgi:hypothetical protein
MSSDGARPFRDGCQDAFNDGAANIYQATVHGLVEKSEVG